jgi:hypothetical protein
MEKHLNLFPFIYCVSCSEAPIEIVLIRDDRLGRSKDNKISVRMALQKMNCRDAVGARPLHHPQ